MYSYDSRDIKSGDIFICLPGGEKFIPEARKRGASEVIKMNRTQMAELAAREFDYPSTKLKVVGVTGTNGKTTVTHVIGQALNSLGYRAMVLGTMNAALTTPESLDIQRIMAEHVSNGGSHFVMEVSSHGIAQNRVNNIDFDCRVLTNITQDHLDYHKTFSAYKATKMNWMAEGSGHKIYPLDYKGQNLNCEPPLIGLFNYENLQAAQAVLQALGCSDSEITGSLAKVNAPAGRFEQVLAGQSYTVLVDYAHTPDGLKNVLSAAKHLCEEKKGRLITVFGCGGDRDRGKRPKMAQEACSFSSFTFITQDNPRTEDTNQIISDILKGIPKDYTTYKVIEDRKLAIQSAIDRAEKNDVVVIAGKGHENYQILGHTTIHFDDRQEALLAIERKEGVSCESIH